MKRFLKIATVAVAVLGVMAYVGFLTLVATEQKALADEAVAQAILAQSAPARDISTNGAYTIGYQTYPICKYLYATVAISNYDTVEHFYTWALTGDTTYTGGLVVQAGKTAFVSYPFNPSTISATVSQPQGVARYKFNLSFTGVQQ
jgi:autotransporter-associated beta strand protein